MPYSHAEQPTGSQRVRALNAAPPRRGAVVLYWMRTARRMGWNFALDRALDWASHLKLPLMIVETVSQSRWLGLRQLLFAAQGMCENAQAAHRTGIGYLPAVLTDNTASTLLESLAQQAAVIVADLDAQREGRASIAALAGVAPCRVETVDSLGLLPVEAADRVFTTAHSFRRFLQKTLPDYLLDQPRRELRRRNRVPPCDQPPPGIPQKTLRQASVLLNCGSHGDGEKLIRDLPVLANVPPTSRRGGTAAARKTLRRFVAHKLASYHTERNHPDADAQSGLSPWLHFGHIAPHEIFWTIADNAGWSPEELASQVSGSRQGWWGMPPAEEAFLDELVTWRELGLNMCRLRDDYDQFDSLPEWARSTLDKHAADTRPAIYSEEQLAAAQTHDALWNAAQQQLRREGVIHNYLRMLWGKGILHWTPRPADAMGIMLELNNRYALDGCDPNSYSGVFWVLGRYDRAWGPERPVFGTVRYMSPDSTRRKLRLLDYLKRFGGE